MTATPSELPRTPTDRPEPGAVSSTPPLQRWLVERRNAEHTPDSIAAELVASGWDADGAARAALRSLRSTDRQSLTYAALALSAGFGALGLATSAHLLIAGNPSPLELTWMLSMTIVALPIAAVTAVLARRIEARSRFVLWSASRRSWFGALALCTATVGVIRLLTYLFSAIATLTGASSADFRVADGAQVLISLAVAGPLFLWSFSEWRRSNLVLSALGDDDRRAAPAPDVAHERPTS
jgi:hypothetical protein